MVGLSFTLEPQTTGKVVIHTSSGDLHVSLWCREAPKACRSFIQAALNEEYNECTFYELVPGAFIQAGRNKSNLHLETIPIEHHQRIQFNRRGLLATVPLEKGKTGCCDFLFTLAATPILKDSCTPFGKVVGDSLFTLMKMAEMDIEEGTEDRPVFCVSISSIEVLQHPFEDLKAEKGKEFESNTLQENSTSYKLLSQSEATNNAKRPIEAAEESEFSKLQQIHLSYKGKAKFGKYKVDEKQLMHKLKDFKNKIHLLETKQQKIQREKMQSEKVKESCLLHCIVNCESCHRSEAREEAANEESWLNHKLVFFH